MKLIEVEKSIYRKHLNIVIVGFVASLMILSVGFGTGLIALFSDNTNTNFRFNLLGVVLALVCCLSLLVYLKHRPFFKEIYYVWQLKQLHNQIFRRLKKIKQASLQGDEKAINILNYYYQSLKQVYTLDDNTLVISKLNKDIDDLNCLIDKENINISIESFSKALIFDFK